MSAEFIKDRLIVFFERSTWEIAYTGNDIQPFLWQKINTELGCESQCSTVPFDKEILAIGNTGVHACNGANVVRIDSKIPDEIFDIKDKELGVQRVAGIRDYFVECVYWSFPASNQDPNFVYPNKVLVYNYQNGTWGINDDTFTAFGYWEQDTSTTWAGSAPATWGETDSQWGSGEDQQQFRQVIAGNQEGFVLQIRADKARNAASMQITNIVLGSPYSTLTIIDATLAIGDFILIENVTGITNLNGNIYQIENINTSLNTLLIETPGAAGAYTGAGTAARVSNIVIQSKQWNPYDKIGCNVYLQKIDFAVQNTGEGGGQVTVDYAPSSSALSISDSEPFTMMGTSILETSPYPLIPLEIIQERLWHAVYFQAEGTCINITISMSFDQMKVPAYALSDFQLEGLVLHTQKISLRLQ